MESTQLEKKSLEAHVDLCAQRYHALEARLDQMDARLAKLETSVEEIRDAIIHGQKAQLKQVLGWATAIITVLLASTGTLFVHYVLR
jgi:predicted  nucleic acid-binding Zn-ribbon protein